MSCAVARGSGMQLARLGKLVSRQSCLFLCDMQDKFRPSIKYFDQIVHNSNRMLQAAKILNVPVVCTEQYPKGLGSTVKELDIQSAGVKALDKKIFTMCLDPVLEQLKKTPEINSIMLCGIEAHVCIQQTAIDLRALGYEVFVIADACSSRGHVERMLAFSLLKQTGCWLTTTESAILSLTGGSDHPQFKELQAIIKPESPDTGLSSTLPSMLWTEVDEVTVAVVSCGERLEETLVLLKSALLFSKGLTLRAIVFGDDDSLYPLDVNLRRLQTVGAKIGFRFRYEVRPVVFPPKENFSEWWHLFRPCASQRLFLPSVLPHVDSLLYLDVDILVLSDLRHIWSTFWRMNSSQMVALAPEQESFTIGWYNRFAKHPYYPPLGLNSGVMLMNLTRLRQVNFEEKVLQYYKEFKDKLTYGDQDLLNIYFHFHPRNLFVYSCSYNYRPDHCIYGPYCSAATQNGIMVLHGNRDVFVKPKLVPFRLVYQAFEKFNMSHDDFLEDLIGPLKNKLRELKGSVCGDLATLVFKNLHIPHLHDQEKNITL